MSLILLTDEKFCLIDEIWSLTSEHKQWHEDALISDTHPLAQKRAPQ